jgi:hypothetical protein
MQHRSSGSLLPGLDGTDDKTLPILDRRAKLSLNRVTLARAKGAKNAENVTTRLFDVLLRKFIFVRQHRVKGRC